MDHSQQTTAQAQLLWTVRGWVEAPLEAAFQALLKVQHIEMSSMHELILLVDNTRTALTEIAPQHFTASIGERGAGRIRYDVDLAQHTVSMQGEFWFRGVYAATSMPLTPATQIEYRIYNLAPGLWRLIVPNWQRSHKTQMQPMLAKTLRDMGVLLNCAVG